MEGILYFYGKSSPKIILLFQVLLFLITRKRRWSAVQNSSTLIQLSWYDFVNSWAEVYISTY